MFRMRNKSLETIENKRFRKKICRQILRPLRNIRENPADFTENPPETVPENPPAPASERLLHQGGLHPSLTAIADLAARTLPPGRRLFADAASAALCRNVSIR
jgi:hypothetical protein